MRSRQLKILMLVISLVVLMCVIVYSNPFVIADKLAGSDYRFVAGAFALSFVGMMLGVLKWKTLLKGAKYFELFPIQVMGYAVSNFTPAKAGEPAKAVVLKMRTDIAVSSSLPSIIWERVMDLLVLVAFSLVAVGSISLNSSFFFPAVLSVGFFVVVVALSFLVLYREKFGRRLFALLRRLPLLNRLPEKFMDSFYSSRIEKKNIIFAFAIAVVTWFVLGLALYSTLLAFGYTINPLVLTGIMSLSVIIGIASSLPGGIGTTEIVMIFLLGLVGVESGVAAAAAITFRLATIWFVNILGGVCFVYLSRKFEIKNIF